MGGRRKRTGAYTHYESNSHDSISVQGYHYRSLIHVIPFQGPNPRELHAENLMPILVLYKTAISKVVVVYIRRKVINREK